MEGFVQFYHNQSNVVHNTNGSLEKFAELKAYIASGIFQYAFSNWESNRTLMKRYQGRTSFHRWGRSE